MTLSQVNATNYLKDRGIFKNDWVKPLNYAVQGANKVKGGGWQGALLGGAIGLGYGIAMYLSQVDEQFNVAQVSQTVHGYQAYKPYKARRRFQRKPYRRYSAKRCPCNCH